jgi:S-adenosylmethionine decarboxylase
MNEGKGATVTGFEGPEKRLEIDFKRNVAYPEGFRGFCKDQWQEMLDLAACTIISHKSNAHFDAYVLSESSLFVFPFKIMIKTCGTTTLLKIIPKLLEYAQCIDLEVELVMFSRKNFLFPEVQVYPHIDWSVEIEYLDQYFDGSSYVLGPLTQHHWYLYLADYSDRTVETTKEMTLEIMMHNLDRSKAINFYRKEDTSDRDKFPGVEQLIPGQDTDEFNFTPCGYSMNGLREEVYSTIHVTPEPHCSYASFETNLNTSCYTEVISRVFDIFKPGTVTLTLFSEKVSNVPGHRAKSLDLPGYVLKYKTVCELGSNRDVVLCNYESLDYIRQKQQKRASLQSTAEAQVSRVL